MWFRSILDRVTAPSNRSATCAAKRRNAVRRLRLESLERRSLLAVVASNDVYAAVEDTPLVVAAPGVLDNDTDSNNDGLSAILVDNPGHGTLSLNSDGSFSYTPNVNFFGTDTFTYLASDGQADSNIAAVTINVSPVNDPPFGINGTVTMAEDTLYTFQVADFNFIDPADFPPNSLAAVRITTLPAAGMLIVNGVPAVAGQFVPVSLIVSGQLRFAPAINASGLPYTSFTFQVQDDGGTFGLAPFPSTLTINVSPVNDPPFGINGTVTMAEDTLYTFQVADFNFIDPADFPPNSLAAVRITTLPAAGMLIVNGVPAVAGQFVPVSLIVSGQLRFAPAINASGLPYTSFTFQVQDDGGTFGLAPFPSTLTINVSPVNDPPFGINGTVTMAEDTLYTFQVADFNFIDPADFPPNSLAAVRITTLPAAGMLIVNGVPAVAGQFVPVSLIVSGQLRFAPAINASGLPYTSFTFQVQDDGGTFGLAPFPSTLTINVSPVNDPPFGINGTVTMAEDTLYTFQVADFNFIDPADFPPNSLAAVRITTLPAAGMLIVNGVPAVAGQFVPVSLIVSGQLRFAPAINASGLPYTSFTFQVQDDGGTFGLAPFPSTLTINVSPVNDPPFGINGTVTMAEDTLYTFQVADFNFIDPADFPPNSLAAVRITTLPAAGMLIVNGVPAVAGQFVPVSLIVSGQLRFAPAINASGLPYTSFTFQVQDDGGTFGLAPFPSTLTINVSPVNDPPVAEDDSYATFQGTPLTVPAHGALGNDSDVDGDSLFSALTTGPSHGAVTLNPDGSFTYTPDSTFAGTDSFTYSISDGTGGSATATVTINVTAAAPGSVVTITDSCLGGTALLITGTGDGDSISVAVGPSPSTLTVAINGAESVVVRPSGRIIVIAGSGDDDVQMNGSVSNPVWLYGDAGNDLLRAGSGGSLLIGGEGDDQLTGGSGRDVLIGGEGADVLRGSGDDDVLVAGLTSFDDRSTAGHELFWCDVLSEWNSSNTFAVRVQNLRDGSGSNSHNNGSLMLPNVVDDVLADVDTLLGGGGDDWLVFNANEDTDLGPAKAIN